MLEQYYRINQAIGVSIHILQNGNLQINACEIAIEQNRLNFVKKVIDVNALEDLKKHFTTKGALALNLSGKGILQKQIERTELIDQQNFNKVLPNGKAEDFYIQNFISGNHSFVSVIRKTEADKWVSQLNELGFTMLMLSIGPFPVQHILPQLNVYDQEVTFNGNIIGRNQQSEWTAYQYKEDVVAPFPLKIESEGINEKLVVAYASAFQLVMADNVQVIQAEVPVLQTALEEIISDKKLKVKASMLLAIFFLLLLANFLLLSWLNSSNGQLSAQVSQSNQSSVDIQSMNDQIKQKEALMQNLGWDEGINKSVLIDQVASLLPEDISWKEIAVNPVDIAASRAARSLVFSARQLRITGSSAKIIPVNEWIARIKTKSWVKDVQLDSYTFNSEMNTGQFILIITY
jgi:Tfp pilus assembly protein PilN